MISIITPVYNGIRFIEACIQVVIDQQCANVEHIIVDGGSTDGTVDVVKRYVAEYSHIRWLSEPDRGQSDAMNKGISLARGEVVGFLNVDDYYEPNVLNHVAEIFSMLPDPSLLVGNCNVWDDEGHLLFVNEPRKLRFGDLLLGPNINPFPVNPSAYFCHQSLITMIGSFALDEHFVMDLDFILRAVQVAKVKYVDEVWGNFRLIEGTKTLADIHAGNIVHRQNDILRRYRKDLPWFHRLQVSIVYHLLNSRTWITVRYFSERPHELPGRLRARLERMLSVRRRSI